eukprot:g20053.t1
MATRAERERQQRQNERHQEILGEMLLDSRECADCGSRGTGAGPGRAGLGGSGLRGLPLPNDPGSSWAEDLVQYRDREDRTPPGLSVLPEP